MSDENTHVSAAAEPVKPPGKRWWAVLQREDWIVVGWVMAIKILLFVFGAKSFRILENKPLPGKSGWLEIWNRWDSLHYLQVAQFGYNAASIMKAWFYPLFPQSTRLMAYVAGNYFVSALIVSGCASVAAAILLRRIVQFDHDARISQWAVWFFLIFPTAYYLHIGYSESLHRTAVRLLKTHPLSAADALQLGAALIASNFEAHSVHFLTEDARLKQAAGKEGFVVD